MPVDGHPTRQACGEAIKAALTTAEATRSESMFVTVDRASNSVVTLIKTKSRKVEPVSSFSLVYLSSDLAKAAVPPALRVGQQGGRW